VGRQSRWLLLSAALAIAGALAGLVPYVIVFLVANELFVVKSGDTYRVVMLAVWAGAAVVAKVLFKALANAASHVAAYRVLADLRLALADKLSRMPLGRVRAYSSGHLKKVLQDDVEQLELGLSHAIPDLSAAIAVPLASIIVMFVMDWRLAIAALLVVVLAVVLVVWGVRRSVGMSAEESRAKSDLSTSIISFLRGMKEIRGFLPGMAGFTATDTAIADTERIENVKMARGKWQAVASTALVGNAVLFLLPLGLWLVHAGVLTSSSLVFFLLVGAGFAQPLMGLMISLAVLQYQIEAGLKNIDEILTEEDLQSPESPAVNDGYRIECRSVRFSYNPEGPEVLRGIDLTVAQGGSLALVGPSGGGKSTIMGMLARFHDPTSGQVRLGGVDLRDMDPVTLMQQVAYVQQDDYLFADTLLNNIRMACPEATDDEVIAAAEGARVADFVPELKDGWQTLLPAGGGTLSGGQRQRISIARAMLKGAGVVLLDEATAFLDPESERGVGEALAELRRRATVVTIAHRLAGVGLASTWWKSANAAIAALQRGVLAHLRRIPLGEYARFDVGRSATLVNSDIPLVDFTNLPAKVIVGTIQPLVSGIVLFVLDWQLALAALAGLPVFLLLLRLSDRAQQTVLGEVTRARSQAASDLLELVRGTSVLRANPDAPQVGRYRAAVERLRRASVAMAVRTTPISSLASVVLELGFAVLVLLVCLRTADQSLPQSIAILLLVVSLSLYRPYQELMDLSSYRHLQHHIVERLAEVWDVDPMPENPTGAPSGTGVELRSVGFGYDQDRAVLKDASFVARPGEVTALVGPSGAGKSTVTNLIARFWDVDSGSVEIGRCDVRELGQDALSGLVTTVYQDVYLFPTTVRENLSMGAPIDDGKLTEALRAAQAWDFVQDMPGGLDAHLTEGGLNLSGGQRQRLAIARTLVKNAPVLLLDEAVAAVDPQTEVRIQEALGHLVRGRTVIVVAHRLNTVQQVDQIVVLANQGTEAAGTHDELLASSPTYRKLWEASTPT